MHLVVLSGGGGGSGLLGGLVALAERRERVLGSRGEALGPREGRLACVAPADDGRLRQVEGELHRPAGQLLLYPTRTHRQSIKLPPKSFAKYQVLKFIEGETRRTECHEITIRKKNESDERIQSN